ncbi:hypothetical protein [Acidiphilium sp.]|uniref:hypothetical protein n=1 Tax=Acidiphilium sp. TaxID=527 RepID=UPI002585BA04|nr:hypothetical protein [Acidiphilium sp.]
MMWEYGMGWGWGWFGMMLFWLVPILLIAVVLKYFFGGGGRPDPGARNASQGALDVLEERYARVRNRSRGISQEARRLEAWLGTRARAGVTRRLDHRRRNSMKKIVLAGLAVLSLTAPAAFAQQGYYPC